jgi:hypothetical protein
MADIRRFSLAYDGEEDRLAWDMLDATGATTRLWLTQKLCRRFATALVEILEKRAAATSERGQTGAIQSFEQAAAMADFGKVPGVALQVGSTSGLVRAVHITPTDGGLTLAFDFGEGETRKLGLSLAAIRQTLALMHKLHGAAAWPMDVWPAWVSDPAAPAEAAAIN